MRLKVDKLEPRDLFVPATELHWSNVFDPLGFSLPCQLPITFRSRALMMEDAVFQGFRLENKETAVRIKEHGPLIDAIKGPQSGFFSTIMDGVNSRARLSYWESELSNGWSEERPHIVRGAEGFPRPDTPSDSGMEEE